MPCRSQPLLDPSGPPTQKSRTLSRYTSVRKRKLKPADVSILYFEHAGNAVTIHNMTLDEHGNLRDAPAGYRDFFVRETDRLLGFAD